MVVVPSGRRTKEGAIIWKAAPTKTSIAREVSEKRVQTYRHGTKVADTARVQIDGEWKRPEDVLLTSTDEKQLEEARTKLRRREELTQTIRARYEMEAEKAKEPTVSKLKTAEEKVVLGQAPLRRPTRELEAIKTKVDDKTIEEQMFQPEPAPEITPGRKTQEQMFQEIYAPKPTFKQKLQALFV